MGVSESCTPEPLGRCGPHLPKKNHTGSRSVGTTRCDPRSRSGLVRMFFSEDLCVPGRFFESGHAPLAAAQGNAARGLSLRVAAASLAQTSQLPTAWRPGTSARQARIGPFLKVVAALVRTFAQLQTFVGSNLLKDGRAVAVHQVQRLLEQVQQRGGPARVLAVLLET